MFDRLFVQDCGLYNGLHFMTIGLFGVLMVVLVICSRKMTPKGADRMIFWLGLLATVLEIIKIGRRMYLGKGPDTWIPLYFCSLFIFCVWLVRFPNRFLQRMGYAFMTMGGFLASILFTFYPSTSLAIYPLICFDSIHSFLYHLIMCYCGALALWKGLYRPEKRDWLAYFVFIMTACVLGVFCNYKLGSNCMFLRHPFGLPVLQPIMEFSKPLYMAIVAFAQGFIMFWVNFGLFTLAHRRKSKTAVK